LIRPTSPDEQPGRSVPASDPADAHPDQASNRPADADSHGRGSMDTPGDSGSAGAALPPTPIAPVSEFLTYLKRRVLGNTVRHHETLPARPAELITDLSEFPQAVPRILRAAEIPALYAHQAEGIRHLFNGDNVVVSTPTASGKTLVYNVPVLTDLLDDPTGHALYIFPLKALEQDQLSELLKLRERLCCPLEMAIYDGDTPSGQRKKLRAHPPNVLITTPDMLHAGFLAYHEAWADFFRHLRYVVIDELHTYSGVFGSHVLHLFRRLHRVCALYGSSPRMVTSSATIGNPAELAGKLLNRRFHAVSDSGAPTAQRHFVFLNPPQSPNTVAADLLRLSVGRKYRTICFTRSRVITELIYRWATQAQPALRRRISSYRAGYMPEERRQIEAALHSGDLLGVVSTSALELGIDIGGLDICILVGYPGSIVNTWQRAGRVGRSGRESLVLLVASKDQLDQYFMKHPAHFFDRGVEEAVVDPSNPYILKRHLECAAREVPLSIDEPEYRIPGWRQAIDELTLSGNLLESADGDLWYSARKQPHRLLNMRSIGESWTIVDRASRQIIGTVSGGQVYSECYDGAVYLHRGRQYGIKGRDASKRQIFAHHTDIPFFTRSQSEKENEILEELSARSMADFTAKLGRVKVSTQVVGYEKVRVGDQVIISQHPLESPVEQFETVGYWLELDDRYRRHLSQHEFHYMGSIHAVEHVMKSLFPLLVLCDRTDVGGISYPMHPQLRLGAVFVYDYRPGGIGLAEKGFQRLDRLLELSLEMVSACPCERGCPSCIHFPTCGHGNVPLDKAGCIHLLELLTGKRALEAEETEAAEPAAADATESAGAVSVPAMAAPLAEEHGSDPHRADVPRPDVVPPIAVPAPLPGHGQAAYRSTPTDTTDADEVDAPPLLAFWEIEEAAAQAAAAGPRVAVFDLETQRSAKEVGGWNKAHLMRVSLAVIWDSHQQAFTTYMEADMDALLEHLQVADLVVGFNVLGFDYSVLRGYTQFDFRQLNTLDMLRDIHAQLRYRVSLDALAKATLGTSKSADGLQALRWWKEGRIELIDEYCQQDVAVTRDLFQFGVDHQHLLFDRKNQGRMRVPVDWDIERLAHRNQEPL
jgi:DEAD/DEAH box helicase domain-containing protein